MLCVIREDERKGSYILTSVSGNCLSPINLVYALLWPLIPLSSQLLHEGSVAIPIPRAPKEPQHRETRGSALQQLTCVPRPSAESSCPSDRVSASDCIWPGSSSTPPRHQCPAGWSQKLVREVPVVPTANPATKAGICRSGAGESGLQHTALRSSSSHGQSWSLPPQLCLTDPSRLCPSLLSQQETTA